MRILVPLLLILLGAAAALAQDASEPRGDRGYLQSLIEDNLSTEDTQVRIEGFVGSLFAESSIDKLTVADADGVWLTLTGMKLDWSRAALLSGRLEVTELSVEEIVLDRLPPGGQAPPSAEARPFRLPELPVEVDIAKVHAGAISLGPSVLGTAASLSLDGNANLAGGAGQVHLKAERLDGPTGVFSIDAGYANDSRVLDLDVRLDEAPNGIAANVLNLRGRPSVRMAIIGSAPLSRYEARLELATDGVNRLSGRVALSSAADSAPDAQTAETAEPPERRFRAELEGDIAPLVAPDLAAFFGDNVVLSLDGRSQPDGRVQIDTLRAETAALRLSGSLGLAPNGLPERFDLTGRIAGPGGQPVILPLPGARATVGAADLTARFDAAADEKWQATATVQNFDRDGLTLGTAELAAEGTIAAEAPRRVTADIDLTAANITHSDAALARALGTDLSGNAALDWTEGQPLTLKTLRVTGAGLALLARGTLDTADGDLTAAGSAEVQADSIKRFSGLAGRDIGGAIALRAEGRGALLGGAFDLSVDGTATDLVTGTPQADRLLTGTSTLRLAARRDETGTELSRFEIRSQAVSATARGTLSSAAGQLDLQAAITDLALIDPRLSGDADLDTALEWKQDAPLRMTRLTLTGGGIDLDGSGEVDLADDALPVTGRAALTVADLARFSGLAGRALSGSLQASVKGAGQVRGSDFDLSLEATGDGLGVGLPEVDKLLAGTSTLAAQVARSDGQYSIGKLDLDTRALTVAAGSTGGAGSPLSVRARLADVGLFAPDFPGPAEVQGTAEPSGDDWNIRLDGTGPGGTTARIEGLIAGDLGDVDLALSGSAPLGMANPFIAPRSLRGAVAYDLQLTGRPDPGNLSGRLSVSGARLSAPTLNMVLSPIDGTVTLAGARAQIDLSARSRDGGDIRIGGGVSLRPGYASSLTVTLSQLELSDPALYRTTVDGQLSLDGPVARGGRISGTIDLGPTEVQVTTGVGGGSGAVSGLTHVNEPAESRRTRARARAGMLATAGDGTGGGGAALGLDVLVRAPNRIFIRGRGLDAEFGGQLRLSGTTRNVIPIGQFQMLRGRLDLLGKRFALSDGLVSMQGSLDPYMRLTAETRTNDITSRIVISGQVSAPDVRFESDPPLPEDEVVAQLLFGRDMSSLSPFQAVQLAGAVATLTGRGGGGIVSKLRSGSGLDDLDITSTESGDTQVRAGKYLSENVYSDISVDSGGKTEVNLNLDINPQLKLKGRVASDGDTGIGVYYQRDY